MYIIRYCCLWTSNLINSTFLQALKFDVSLPTEYFDDLVVKTQEIVGDDGVCIGHGHIGDGNLHLNCCIKGHNRKELAKEIQNKI